jgi:hypothetical protein
MVYTLSVVTTGGDDECAGSSYVSSVVGYKANYSGMAAPVVTITSPNTEDVYSALATDSSGNIYVLSTSIVFTAPEQLCEVVPGSGKVLVFAPPASGSVTATPIRTIRVGENQNFLAVDGPGNVYVTGFTTGGILEFPTGANGNVAPIRTINLANGTVGPIAVDGSGNIAYESFVSPSAGVLQAIIKVFTPDQSGNAIPARTITSGLVDTSGLSLDSAGNIYVRMIDRPSGNNESILEFSGGANGNSKGTPINSISIAAQPNQQFEALTLDAVGNLYVLDVPEGGAMGASVLLRYSAGATGSASPTIETLSVSGAGIAVH